MAKLGEMKILPIREVFPHEEYDFTKHFEKEENLNRLGNALNLDLELRETESRVGRYEADVWAKCDNENVVIENQYGYSDHDHFGKILTYAAGKDANILIWIVENARDEHRAAIRMLNEKSDLKIFMVEIKAIAIEDVETKKLSLPAIDYDIVEKPNEFIKENKEIDKTSNNKFKPFWERCIEVGKEFKDFSDLFSFGAKSKGWCRLKEKTPVCSKKITFDLTSTEKEFRLELIVDRDFYNDTDAISFNKIIEDSGASFEEIRSGESETYNIFKRGFMISYSLKDDSTWKKAITTQLNNAIKVRNAINSALNS